VLTSTPWWPTALAVALAVIAAVGFAYGALLQQRAVAEATARTARNGAAVDGRAGIGVESFRWLVRQSRWRAGWAVIAGGALLHGLALLLAPVSVIQPIGVLAVPVAVLLTARQHRSRPRRAVILGVALAVAGTGTFVLLAGSAASADRSDVTLTDLLAALLIVATVTGALAVTARSRTGRVRCLGYTGVGAVSFGLESALVHVIGQALGRDLGLSTPLVITAALAGAAALALGAWAVQQAYASGPSAVVVGTLTVGDPVVAILLSAGLLGGGLALAPVALAAMVGCAATSAVGIRLLATHHPAALPAPHHAPVRELTTVR
jgi:hypothetical protein